VAVLAGLIDITVGTKIPELMEETCCCIKRDQMDFPDENSDNRLDSE
jgi:hypothetical protein